MVTEGLKPGDLLPLERELSESYQISRSTMGYSILYALANYLNQYVITFLRR